MTIDDVDHPWAPGDEIVFGRAPGVGMVGLDEDDRGISRIAGRLRALTDSTVIVENLSSRRHLYVEYADLVRHQQVPPETEHLLTRSALVLVPGRVYTHRIRVEVEPTTPAARPSPPSALTTTIDDVLRPEERRALAALGEGYLLRWPRHDPNPRSYEAAAVRLGWTSSTLRKRIEHLRLGFADRDVVHATGENARRELLDYAIDTGILTVDDLDRI